MGATYVFAGIAVADYPAARAWYERLLGRAPDMLPHDAEAAWQLTDSGWIYVVADAERAGRALVTVLVDDLDEITGNELAGGPVETVPGKFRRVAITDPEGNRVTFAQSLAG
jgi:catechol 2,3-dioxygenase-like lactoylglutathione lyase family enzyme